MYLVDRLARVAAFLRAAYPAGMPATGYVPLVALLPRRVTEDEIVTLTSELIARRRWPISNADVGVEITRITHEMPSPEDIERVQRRIDAMGRSRSHRW